MVEGSILSPDKVFAAITSLPDREQVLLELAAAGDSHEEIRSRGLFSARLCSWDWPIVSPENSSPMCTRLFGAMSLKSCISDNCRISP